MPKAEDGMQAPQGAPQGQPQEGGGDPMQQIMQMAQQMAEQGAEPMQIVQALMEQGVPPEAIGQVLVQLGMPEEQVQQVMQQIMQGGQEGQPQGEPQPQEGGQPMMAVGGEFDPIEDDPYQNPVDTGGRIFNKDNFIKTKEKGNGRTVQREISENRFNRIQNRYDRRNGDDDNDDYTTVNRDGNKSVSGISTRPTVGSTGGWYSDSPGISGGVPSFMAQGGQAMEEQDQQQQIQQLIMMFAEIQGQDPEEIMQMLQQAEPKKQQEMLQQIAQVVQQDQEQGQEQGQQIASYGGQAGATHYMEDGTEMPGAYHGASEGELEYMMSGGKKDFAKLKKSMIKEYRKGGMTDDANIDSNTVAGHYKDKKSALERYMHSGYAVNTIKKSTDNSLGMFNEIPKAEPGMQVQGKSARPSWLGTQGYRTYTEDNSRGKVYEGRDIGYDNTDYYGVKRSMNPGVDFIRSFRREGNNEPEFRGFGDFAGKSIQDLTNAIGTTHELVSNEPLWKQKRFGKNKGKDKVNIFGNKKEIGRRLNTRLIQGQANPSFNPIAGEDANQTQLDDATLGRLADLYPNGVPPEVMQAELSKLNTVAPKVTTFPKTVGDKTVAPEVTTFPQTVNSETPEIAAFRDELDNKPLTRRQLRAGAKQVETSGYNPDAANESMDAIQQELGIVGDYDGLTMDEKDLIDEIYFARLNDPNFVLDMEEVASRLRPSVGTLPQRSNGGAVARWDSKQRRFIPMAEGGYEEITMNTRPVENVDNPYLEEPELVENSGFDIENRKGKRNGRRIAGAAADAYGHYGNKLSSFLQDMNDYVTPEEKAVNRAKVLENIRPVHSGDSGVYYDNLQNQMSADNKGKLPGTGSDDLSFGQDMTFVNSGFARNGGLIKGAKGMQTGSEHYLTKAQEGMLVKAGYKLKRLY